MRDANESSKMNSNKYIYAMMLMGISARSFPCSEISQGWRGYQDLNNRRDIISPSNTHLWRGPALNGSSKVTTG